MGHANNEYDERIELAQELITLFKQRGVALGDEIHLILNVIEALDYSEGDRLSLRERSEYYESMSAVFRTIYPSPEELANEDRADYNTRSRAIADKLKIAENRQAQVNPATIREAMQELAALFVDQAVGRLRKNKEGQTYSTIYRESLKQTIHEDLRIAEEKAQQHPENTHHQEEVARLRKLILNRRGADGQVAHSINEQKQDTVLHLEEAKTSLADVRDATGYTELRQAVTDGEAALETNEEREVAEAGLALARENLEDLLNSPVAEQLRIAEDRVARLEAQVTWLGALARAQGNTPAEVIDVRALTQHSESVALKLRRFYGAVSEMENILMQAVRTHLCSADWKSIFTVFEQRLFVPSQKSADQLLAIRVPRDPLEVLHDLRDALVGEIDRAMRTEITDAAIQSLASAQREIINYSMPEADQLPDKVVSSRGESTNEVEAQRQAEAERHAEREIEAEATNISLAEVCRSETSGEMRTQWHEWTPKNVTHWLRQEAGDLSEDAVASLSAHAHDLFGHIRTDGRGPVIENIDYNTLFSGLSATKNMMQVRETYRYYGNRMDDTTYSLLSQNQKAAQSVAELSLERDRKRVFHHLMLDVRDHATFSCAMQRAHRILTPAFLSGVTHLADGPLGDRTLLQVKGEDAYIALFGDHDDATVNLEFLQRFLGSSLTLKELSTLSIRLSMRGRYTETCGVLSRKDVDDQALKALVRRKLIMGDSAMTKPEINLLRQMVLEEWFGLVDEAAVTREAERQNPNITPEEIEAKVIERCEELGLVRTETLLQDRTLGRLTVPEMEKTLFNILRLHEHALMIAGEQRVKAQKSPVFRLFSRLAAQLKLSSRELLW